MTDGSDDASGAGDPATDGPSAADDRTVVERSACAESDCERPAAVLLHVPWDEDRAVCPAHARVLARPDGVVAEPIEGAEAEWP